ncbi:hypothetical protein BS47DRAFT_1385468 [Hydnum rufescens UP504]|uniref:Uncharacterized protein n=1 Tax=Hydnum rufescens UP504 TaxID=1448309 RepID=A0A9P6DQI6_9AGAM|nr:hypothetical protein BS47DRAFT_1385468 [Hydnum rufescens UP504]
MSGALRKMPASRIPESRINRMVLGGNNVLAGNFDPPGARKKDGPRVLHVYLMPVSLSSGRTTYCVIWRTQDSGVSHTGMTGLMKRLYKTHIEDWKTVKWLGSSRPKPHRRSPAMLWRDLVLRDKRSSLILSQVSPPRALDIPDLSQALSATASLENTEPLDRIQAIGIPYYQHACHG